MYGYSTDTVYMDMPSPVGGWTAGVAVSKRPIPPAREALGLLLWHSPAVRSSSYMYMHIVCNVHVCGVCACMCVCSAWMLPAELSPYEDNREKFRLPKKVKGFAEAIWEIEEDPSLVISLGKTPSRRRKRSTGTPGNSSHSNKEGVPQIKKEKIDDQVCTFNQYYSSSLAHVARARLAVHTRRFCRLMARLP